MENNTSYKTKRKLETMRNNMNKRNEERKSVFPLNGIYLFSELIKKQNIDFLKNIANDKLLNEEEKELFIEKYSKLNYQIPEIVSDHKKEEMQKYL